MYEIALQAKCKILGIDGMYQIYVGMDEIYETAPQAKYKILRIDEMCKIRDGWNVPN